MRVGECSGRERRHGPALGVRVPVPCASHCAYGVVRAREGVARSIMAAHAAQYIYSHVRTTAARTGVVEPDAARQPLLGEEPGL